MNSADQIRVGDSVTSQLFGTLKKIDMASSIEWPFLTQVCQLSECDKRCCPMHTSAGKSETKDLKLVSSSPRSMLGEFKRTERIACVAQALVIT
jgi:hypothetical protein